MSAITSLVFTREIDSQEVVTCVPYDDRMFTIDELAREAGTRTSTVRLYQTRGLLPPPEIRGRGGYHGPGHACRLGVIERLQARGYSLAAIKELLENWAQGATLAAVLDPH